MKVFRKKGGGRRVLTNWPASSVRPTQMAVVAACYQTTGRLRRTDSPFAQGANFRATRVIHRWSREDYRYFVYR